MHAARTHDEVQARSEQHGDEHVDHQHGYVRRDHLHQRDGQQGGEHDPAELAHDGWCRSDRWLDLGSVTRGALLLAEQTPGAPDEHGGHHQKLHHQRELGEGERRAEQAHLADADAERLDLRNQQRSQKCTRDAAHAADHHDDERIADRGKVESLVGWLARHLQCAAQSGEQRAEREHAGKQPRLVHAERTHHLAILRGRAHQRAPARPAQQPPHHPKHQRTDEDERQVVLGKLLAEDVDRAAQPCRARTEQVLRAPDRHHNVLEHQHQREGSEQLKQLGRLIDPAQQQHFDDHTDRRDHQRREQHTGPEAKR